MGQVELTATASYSLGQAILVSVVKAQGKRAQRKVSGKDLGRLRDSKGQVVLARRKAGSLQEGPKCGVVSG